MASVRTILSCLSGRPIRLALIAIALAGTVALDAQTAAPLSSVPATPRATVSLTTPPAHAPAIGPGRVYLVFESGHVAAHRLSDAREIWRADLAAIQPPVTSGELVLLAVGGEVHALHGRDGSPAWRADTGIVIVPLLAHEGWVIAATATHLFALREVDGSVVWSREHPALAARATIEGDRLYTPLADGRVQALELRTGANLWSRRLGGAPTSVLAFPDRVYVGSADRHFYALHAGGGAIEWRFRVGAALRGAPAARDGLVYTVSLDNLVRAYDRGHGARSWNEGIPYRALAGPLVIGGALLVAGPSAQVVVFDSATGKPLAPLAFDAPLVAPVAVGMDGQLTVLAAVVGSLESGWRLVLRDSSYAVPLVPLTALPGEVLPLWKPGT